MAPKTPRSTPGPERIAWVGYWAALKAAGLDKCTACNRRRAKWATPWGRLCGLCRRHMQAELRAERRRQG